MSDPAPTSPAGLVVLQIRAYYDPDSGEMIDLHQLVSAPDDVLDAQTIEDEMAAYEEQVRRRMPSAQYLTISESDLPLLHQGSKVDVERKSLIPRGDPSD